MSHLLALAQPIKSAYSDCGLSRASFYETFVGPQSVDEASYCAGGPWNSAGRHRPHIRTGQTVLRPARGRQGQVAVRQGDVTFLKVKD